MALYEYKCDGCGEVFEIIQKFVDEPLVTHDKCGAPVHRLLSAPALQFKGSGWYVNDYAKGSAQQANTPSKKTEGSGDSGSSSDSGGASNSTPAATTTSNGKSDTK